MAVSRLDMGRRRPRGLSLIEAVVSVVIVSLLLLGAMTALGASIRRTRRESERETGLVLAQALMGEILQAHFEDPDATGVPSPGPDAGEHTRADFDDIDDYHGWIASPPQDRDGAALPGAEGYTRSVTVAPFAEAADAATSAHLKQITVEVFRENRPAGTLTALRSDRGSLDRTPVSEATFVRWVGVTLQLGEGGPVLHGGTAVLNQIATEAGP